MKVVITGGTGFVGKRLADAVLQKGELIGPSGTAQPVEELVLFDQFVPDGFALRSEPRVSIVQGDISDKATIDGLIDRDDVSVFHLASVVSGGGEKDFDLAIRVNLDGGRHIMEALRARQGVPRLVIASSIAVFGGAAMPDQVGDTTKQTPQTTYGITKAISELLINDYTRKGFLDGRSARLPTVIIRPGKPNAAASSFVSGLFREPLDGVDIALPVKEETIMPVLGYRAIVDGIIRLHEISGDALGDDRAVSLPAHTVTVRDMIDALYRVAGDRALGKVTIEPDPFIEDIVRTWARDTYFDRATTLGLPREDSIDDVVSYYIDDYLNGT